MPETLTVEKPEVVVETTTPTHPIRIAFIGAAGSGKTTHAKLMQKQYKGDVLSFATPLKKICSMLFGDRMEDDREFARKALQIIGTDAIRSLDPGTWIRLLMEKISTTRNCFVDDCRFPNEYYALRNIGFNFVRLDATTETLMRRRPTLTREQAAHESEQHQLFFHADVTVRSDPAVEIQKMQQILAAEEKSIPTKSMLLQLADDTEEDILVTHELILVRLKQAGIFS